MFIVAVLSNRASSPSAMRPDAGVSNPATARSKLDFPAPLGPKIAVMPRGLNCAEAVSVKAWRGSDISTDSALPDTVDPFSIEAIEREQHKK